MILMSFHNVLSKVRKIEKIKTFDLNYFFDKFFFDDDGFQNMFIYQLPLNMLELKEHKDTELSVYWNTQHSNVIEWKSKGAYTSELTVLNLQHHILHTCIIVIKVSTCIVAME